MAASSNVLTEALKLPVRERVRIAEKLLESADAEGDLEDTGRTVPQDLLTASAANARPSWRI